MGSKNKIFFLIAFIIFAVASLLLVNNKLYNYAIITSVCAVVFLLILLINLFNNRTPEDSYNTFIRDSLKTFDAVLVNTDELPNIDDRSLVVISNFEDLIDAQIEIRKPIYYKRNDRSAIFILLDDKQACVCVVKVTPKEKSEFDDYLNEQKRKKEAFNKALLADIENTTIVKLDNNKSYKITPLNSNKNKKELKNKHDIVHSIEGLPKLKDTIDISKTQIFKNLNDRKTSTM